MWHVVKTCEEEERKGGGGRTGKEEGIGESLEKTLTYQRVSQQ